MTTDLRASRTSRVVAWLIAANFILAWFFPFLGACTGPLTTAWFVGTQKPLRGFVIMAALTLVSRLVSGGIPAGGHLGPLLAGIVYGVLPFTLHRLIAPHLPGLLFTLPLPLAAVALAWPGQSPGYWPFFAWAVAVILWMWNHEANALATAGLFLLTSGMGVVTHFAGPTPDLGFTGLRVACLGGLLLLGGWAALGARRHRPWAERTEAVLRLQSPVTGNALKVVSQPGREVLVSASGERFPIRDGMPVFIRPEDLSGANGKYHRLYQVINGLYDDIQRVWAALRGFDRDAFVMGFMGKLAVKPGDLVLETSVGTGLNFKKLPAGVRLSGLDLSTAMLAICQDNLVRWGIAADLYVGNAESLPFADDSFDVVFHVGGINFFNDRAKAIGEMVRVAKPGSLLMIADETEKHVKGVYEMVPGNLYRNRETAVSAPIDLVPAGMQDLALSLLRDDEFYVITFRKPQS